MSYTRRKHTSLSSITDRLARGGQKVVEAEKRMEGNTDSQGFSSQVEKKEEGVEIIRKALDDYDIYLSGREEASE